MKKDNDEGQEPFYSSITWNNSFLLRGWGGFVVCCHWNCSVGSFLCFGAHDAPRISHPGHTKISLPDQSHTSRAPTEFTVYCGGIHGLVQTQEAYKKLREGRTLEFRIIILCSKKIRRNLQQWYAQLQILLPKISDPNLHYPGCCKSRKTRNFQYARLALKLYLALSFHKWDIKDKIGWCSVTSTQVKTLVLTYSGTQMGRSQ